MKSEDPFADMIGMFKGPAQADHDDIYFAETRNMSSNIRPAQPYDVPAMVDLSEQKRTQYQQYQPTFWRKADDAREKQRPFFEHLVQRDDVITLVYEQDGKIEGFIIADFVNAPPVYDPGGPTCRVDDFCLADEGHWEPGPRPAQRGAAACAGAGRSANGGGLRA